MPETARIPEVTTDVPVGAMRAFEFTADEMGDWAIHCHKSHHTMNAMGHDVKTFIGVDKRTAQRAIRRLVPDYMPMGSAGMAEMGEMEMPMPDNTLPMMTGFGPFGPVEMGGMFSVVKVRKGIARDDYKDPPDYDHPPGTVAYEFKGKATEPCAPGRRRQAKRHGWNSTSSSLARNGPPNINIETNGEINVMQPWTKSLHTALLPAAALLASLVCPSRHGGTRPARAFA